jgi:Gas vesicle synthesis protein GvpL/GvpF
MIWVYGICDRPDMPPPRRRGIAQAPLDGVREGELLAVISRHVHPPGDPALDTMWVHERVVERMMADRAVLPMRFGSKLPDEAALRDVLATRQHEFLATLARVRGRVEVGVRAMQPGGIDTPLGGPLPAPPQRAAASGREYLEAKLRNGRRADHEAGVLHEPLAQLAVEVRRQPARAPEELLRAAYLIETPVLGRFRGTVERLQREHPGIAILCTGPWPPYSFVGPAAVASEPVAGGSR